MPNDAGITSTASTTAAAADIYQNDDFANRNSIYTNRETVLCDTKYPSVFRSNSVVNESTVDYCNIGAVAEAITAAEMAASNGTDKNLHQIYDRKMSLKESPNDSPRKSFSFIEQRESYTATNQIRKVPEHLNLIPESFVDGATATSSPEPLPALSTSSGPYIPISECFSGSPPFLFDSEPPMTPLNSLDPRFYDTPRSHMNIGLNLTNEQPYSPKHENLVLVKTF